MSPWVKDLSIAARSLLRRPGFTVVVSSTLALGVGANTAIFTVVKGAALRPLPFPDPDAILWLSDGYQDWGGYGSSQSLPNILDLKAQATQVSALEAYTSVAVNLATEDRPERVRGLLVGPDFLRVLGLAPSLGRDLADEDNVVGAAEVVILGHDLWLDLFGGDPAVVGRSIQLDATPYSVVGVLPAAFEFQGTPRFIAPLKYEGRQIGRRGRGYNAIARLAPGATLDGAREELRGIFARLAEEYPEANEGWQVWAQPLKDLVVGTRSLDSLRLLGGAALLVLLIACMNVANLLLVRADARRREIAVRLALGGGRGGMARLFVSEGLLLGALGGALGIGVAAAGVPALVSLFGASLARGAYVDMDLGAFAFGMTVSLGSGLLVGLLPTLRQDITDLHAGLKDGTRAVSKGGRRLRHGLVVSEVALAVVLVSGAGLLLNSFVRLSRVDVGLVEPEQVLVTQLALSGTAYPDEAAVTSFFRDLVAQVSAAPGVEVAGVTNRLPLNGGYNITDLFAYGDPAKVAHFVELRSVTPGFFDAAGIRLLAGRSLTEADGYDGRSIVATQELAVRLFGSAEAAVGRSVVPGGQEESLQVVGVVSDVRDLGLARPAPPGYYMAQGPATVLGSTGTLLVRTHGDAMGVLPALQEAVRRLDPGLPLFGTRRLDDVVAASVGSNGFNLALVGLFAVLALVLGAVGIYGVVSYSVSERTREVGLRMALGARDQDVVGMVVRGGLRLTGAGVALGLLGAVASGRLLQGMLYEVPASDPFTLVAVATVLIVVSLLASWIPARRAARVDPLDALRQE